MLLQGAIHPNISPHRFLPPPAPQVSVSVLQPGYIQSEIFTKHEKTQDPLTPECERVYGHLYNWDVRTSVGFFFLSSIHQKETSHGIFIGLAV